MKIRKSQSRLLGLFLLFTALFVIVLLTNPSLLRLAGAALSITTITCEDISEIPANECLALYELFGATNGMSWGDRTGWFVTTAPCTWYGVNCKEGHIASLVMDSNQLTGNLTDLSGLSELEVLSLSRNQLSGNLPSGLGQLSKLIKLDLSFNQFTGPVPASLGDLRNLKKLYLQANLLSGAIPIQLGNLANLEELSLHYNQLDNGIPASLGNFSRLRILRLSHNQLADDIPSNLRKLGQLEELDLSFNKLTGSIPEQLGDLNNLQKMYLHNNMLEGEIPASFSDLTALLEINLMNNQLSGNVPPALGELDNLIYLNISGNQLNGSLPPELSNATNLQQLILKSNLFSGGIPEEIGNVVGLKTLDVSHNAFEGEIPPSLTAILESGPDIWNYVSFGYNRLEAEDPTLIDYLDLNDPFWHITQTIPPTNLSAHQISLSSIELNWTPIPYTENDGFYEVSFATTIDGPYTVAGNTTDKTIGNFQINDMLAGTLYYFRVRTFTPAHDNQANDLWSTYTLPTPMILSTEIPQEVHLFLPLVVR